MIRLLRFGTIRQNPLSTPLTDTRTMFALYYSTLSYQSLHQHRKTELYAFGPLRPTVLNPHSTTEWSVLGPLQQRKNPTCLPVVSTRGALWLNLEATILLHRWITPERLFGQRTTKFKLLTSVDLLPPVEMKKDYLTENAFLLFHVTWVLVNYIHKCLSITAMVVLLLSAVTANSSFTLHRPFVTKHSDRLLISFGLEQERETIASVKVFLRSSSSKTSKNPNLSDQLPHLLRAFSVGTVLE
mmetsp:Transcript_20141/g.25437  ORF Transcript_20141/g.25437 Transcript_20141/m.25437 type:complete len:242 (-) Transcript_20141:1668-2393(-)